MPLLEEAAANMPHSFGPQSSPSGMENFKEVSDLYMCLSLFVHSRIKCLSSCINHTCNTPCWAFGGEEEVDTTWEKSYFEFNIHGSVHRSMSFNEVMENLNGWILNNL